MRTVYGDHQRFIDTYFKTYPGKYFTGDGARRDADGYYWITGRVDDVINVSGHRIGTAEVESALVGNTKVAEAAVVGFPHDIKGQGIYAYVTLKAGQTPSDDLRKELVAWVRKEIGPIATPDVIQWAPGLPKTRSGKIMRRILRKIAENDFSNLGDTSTLADPAVVDDLVKTPEANEPDHPAACRRPRGRPHHLAQAHRRGARPHRGSRGRRRADLHQGLQGAGAGGGRGQRRAAQGGDGAGAARRHSRLDQEPVRRRRRDDAVRLPGARRRAACAAGRAGGGATAGGRRGDRRQHQHERVRLLGRRLQPALRHAAATRPTASACRAAPRPVRRSRSPIAWPWPRSAPTPAARCAFRPRSAASSASSRRRGACRSTAWCRSRPRSIRSARSPTRSNAAPSSMRYSPAEPIVVPERGAARRPALRGAQALRDGRPRSAGRHAPSSGPAGPSSPRASRSSMSTCRNSTSCRRSTPKAASPPPKPMPGTRS